MIIYFGHEKKYDWIKIKDLLGKNFPGHSFIFPYEQRDLPLNSKQLITQEIDYFIAEVSTASTGLGIELGWAELSGVKIICVHQENTKPSRSLKFITNNFIVYQSPEELTNKLKEVL